MQLKTERLAQTMKQRVLLGQGQATARLTITPEIIVPYRAVLVAMITIHLVKHGREQDIAQRTILPPRIVRSRVACVARTKMTVVLLGQLLDIAPRTITLRNIADYRADAFETLHSFSTLHVFVQHVFSRGSLMRCFTCSVLFF